MYTLDAQRAPSPTTGATHVGCLATRIEVVISSEYQDLAEFFSKVKANELPRHGPQDHAIELESGDEQMFSKLKARSSIIFRKIVKTFEAGDPGLWLTRDERNLVRKFLFLLKYRGSTFHDRFYHNNPEEYSANNRESLYAYMKEKGFARPVDVWFANLKAILELQMDAQEAWLADLPTMMYPPDARWCIMHVQMNYMAICTPANPQDEYILTDNSYNIYEGPERARLDIVMGKVEGMVWINFHEFAPLSPKLMIVLRSFNLPLPEEDKNEEVRELRKFWYRKTVEEPFGSGTTSVLADLPISKPLNNYTEVVNGVVQPLLGEDGTKRRDHKFFFRLFPITTKHVNKINALLLDNTYQHCTRV